MDPIDYYHYNFHQHCESYIRGIKFECSYWSLKMPSPLPRGIALMNSWSICWVGGSGGGHMKNETKHKARLLLLIHPPPRLHWGRINLFWTNS